MDTFEVNSKRLKKIVPTWKVIFMWFFIINAVSLTNFIRHYPYNLICGELIFFVFITILLSRKAYRYVYKVTFDNKAKVCTVFYYQYQFFRFKKSIKYSSLNFLFERIPFTRLEIAQTLRIKDGNKMIVDIRERYNMGYTNDEIKAIFQKITEIKKL